MVRDALAAADLAKIISKTNNFFQLIAIPMRLSTEFRKTASGFSG